MSKQVFQVCNGCGNKYEVGPGDIDLVWGETFCSSSCYMVYVTNRIVDNYERIIDTAILNRAKILAKMSGDDLSVKEYIGLARCSVQQDVLNGDMKKIMQDAIA